MPNTIVNKKNKKLVLKLAYYAGVIALGGLHRIEKATLHDIEDIVYKLADNTDSCLDIKDTYKIFCKEADPYDSLKVKNINEEYTRQFLREYNAEVAALSYHVLNRPNYFNHHSIATISWVEALVDIHHLVTSYLSWLDTLPEQKRNLSIHDQITERVLEEKQKINLIRSKPYSINFAQGELFALAYGNFNKANVGVLKIDCDNGNITQLLFDKAHKGHEELFDQTLGQKIIENINLIEQQHKKTFIWTFVQYEDIGINLLKFYHNGTTFIVDLNDFEVISIDSFLHKYMKQAQDLIGLSINYANVPSQYALARYYKKYIIETSRFGMEHKG